MAQYLNKRGTRPRPYVLEDFGGLDPRGGEGGFTRLENFRIIDGRLVKRGGSKVIEEFPDDIRGLWYGDFDGEYTLFCVSGSMLYRGIGSDRIVVGALSSVIGKVCMFYRRGRLYLLDGIDFYESDGETLEPVEGYVPMIRLSTDENTGTDYYDRNMLTDRVRMRFTGASVGDDYPLYGDVAVVESATLNGSAASYTVSGSGQNTTVAITSGYGTLIVTYRLKDVGNRDELCSQLYSLVYSSLTDETVFLYGGPVASRVFYSGHVEGEPRIDYFPTNNRIDAGTGDRPVTAMLRQYDSLLVFTSGETYMTEPYPTENDNLYYRVIYPLYTLNPNIGCQCGEGARQADDSPISVSRDGIYRWIETDTQGERTAQLVSERIDSLLTKSLIYSSITHVCRRYGEFWLYDGTTLLVYGFRSGLWYCFTGIDADGFVETEDTCYYKGNTLYGFDEESGEDGGTAFNAVAETTFLDFGHPHLNKRLHRIFVSYEPSSTEKVCSAVLTLESDCGDIKELATINSMKDVAVTLRLPGLMPRFTFLRLTLSDKSGAPMRLTQLGMQYHLLAEANVGEGE